jgi:hypothetical protein
MGGHLRILLIPINQVNDKDWNCFIDQFKALPISIQRIILKKLHGNTLI